MKTLKTSFFLLIIASHFCNAFIKIDTIAIEPFGKVNLYIPDGDNPESVIIMISGDAGWRYGVPEFASHFASKKSFVIGVDILSYYKNLKKRSEDCYHISSDFITLATTIEKKYNLPKYQEPILMGYSSGATMVYALLAQARPDTFRGGISLGFCTDVELSKRFCEINGLKEHPMINGKGFDLDPDSELGNRWIVLQGKLDNICNFETTKDFLNKTTDNELIELPKVGHGFGDWKSFMPQWDAAYLSLLDDKKPDGINPLVNNKQYIKIKDLPITITKAKIEQEEAPLVFFISGDGGWYSFEQNLANKLANVGVPSVGLDAKKYFWNKKKPQTSAQDISKLLYYYTDLWNKNRIVLIGYSMGADVMPFIFEQLPKDLQNKTEKIVLLSPSERTDFEIHIVDMIGIGSSKDNYNVLEALKRISVYSNVVIINGLDEKSKLPSKLSSTKIKFETVPGDHHYNNDSLIIFNKIRY